MSSAPWQEPDYWEARFQEKRIPWDLGGPSPTLMALEKAIRLPLESRVLVPGCGYGEDALYFASRGFQVTVVDFARSAINKIRGLASERGLILDSHEGDFFDLPESWSNSFDVVIEDTFFCALDPKDRSRYLHSIRKVLKADSHFLGALYIKDPAQPEMSPPHAGPPFSISERETIQFFSDDFDILTLAPSPQAPPSRGGCEWWAHFRRRREDGPQ